MPLGPLELDWKAAIDLMAAFRAGRAPSQTVVEGLDLPADEPVYAWLPVRVMRMEGIHLAFANSDPTRHGAAARWMDIDHGAIAVTGRRARIYGANLPVDFFWVAAARCWLEIDGTAFDFPNGQFKIVTHAPVWLDVLINRVGYGRNVDRPVPDFVTKALWRESWKGRS